MSMDWIPGHDNNDSEDSYWQPHAELLYDQQLAVAKPTVNQSELLCRTGCGFYGYPAWQGHCSKCFRELHARNAAMSAMTGKSSRLSRPVFDPTNIKKKVSRSVSDVSDLSGKASLLINKKIDKLEEKRKQQFQKNNKIVKSIFKKTILKDEIESNKAALKERSSPSQDFDSFLKTLSKEGGGAVRKQVSLGIEKVKKLVHTLPLEELADAVQEIYSTVHNMVTSHTTFANLSSEDVSRLSSLTEGYVMSQLHPLLFTVVNAYCEERDLGIQKRIRNLSTWLTPEHIGCKLNETDNNAAIDTIIEDLLEIDGKVIPSDKLSVVVGCSHEILQTLSANSNTPASADDFLPALIYCLVKANPPMLHSNMDYVTHFAPQSQLQSGEKGYYFTNLCCAVAFIEKVCGASLGLTEQEFTRQMSGKALPPDPKVPSSITALEGSVERFNEAINSVDEINSTYNEISEKLIQTDAEVDQKVEESLTRHPLDLRPPHTLEELRKVIQGGEAPPQQEEEQVVISQRSNALPECEEAFNLYYSLQESEKDSPTAAPATQPSSSTPVGTLLDEPVPSAGITPLLADLSRSSDSLDAKAFFPSSSSPQPEYFGMSLQSESIPSIPCDLGSSSVLTPCSSRDAFSPSSDFSSNLPAPLIPTPCTSSRTDALMDDYMASLSGGGVVRTPTTSGERKGDALDKVVDVLSSLADKVDELL